MSERDLNRIDDRNAQVDSMQPSASGETGKEWLLAQLKASWPSSNIEIELLATILAPALARKLAEERLEEAQEWHKWSCEESFGCWGCERIADLEKKVKP